MTMEAQMENPPHAGENDTPMDVPSENNFEKGNPVQGCRVYVGNLAYSVRWQDLKDHMSEAGEVAYVEVFQNYNGSSKGCGIVEYASQEGSQKAIDTMNDTDLNGRPIFVREDREKDSFEKKSDREGKQIFVGNLPYSVSWQDLKDLFREAGNVVRADVLLGHDGRSRGQGTVLFETEAEALTAIDMFSDKEFDGRALNVHLDKFANSAGGRGGMRGGRGGRRGFFKR
eukprot:Nk52_evm21s1967 gene=Nk52_evmTU21s1967